MKNGKRRSWTTVDVRTLKSLARKKTRAAKIAKTLNALRERRAKRRLVWAYRLTLGSSVRNTPGYTKKEPPRLLFSFGVLSDPELR